MDNSDPNLVVDNQGICNHCHRYDNLLNKRVFIHENANKKLENLLKKIKKSRNKDGYDCIIGISGGVDSTYVAYLVKKMGLNPLAIHFDNGWNSELAVSNIEKVLDLLDIDLYTHVIDWPTFKDLQISFLKSSTPDGEIPTDHAINALLFREANNRKIKWVINGMNFTTESSSVPAWSYGHSDWKYIKSIHNLFGTKKLLNYPKYSFFDLFWWTFVKRIKVVSILNYVDYKKADVMNLLINELGWVYYGGKHYESVYTRFFQGYILPKKFNIDKRIVHLSDLIRSEQISREVALNELQSQIYDPILFLQDKIFVLKKLGLTEDSFNKILELPKKTYKDYPNSEAKVIFVKKVVNLLRQLGFYSK
jgi:N-acetyl sugar amidotransferase